MSDEPTVVLLRAAELAPGSPYAHAAVMPPGSHFVVTAGACPLNAAGEIVGRGDVATQATHVMDNLEAALHAAGAELRDVAKTTVYVATERREDLVAAWRVVRERFADHDPPSTLLGVTMLGYPDQLVEVEAVASVPHPG